MKKLLLIFGTRPEAIKMCPLVLELNKRKSEFSYVVCVTGQHRELLDQVLEVFEIKPSYDLNLMTSNQSLSGLTSKILTKLDEILIKENPDYVLVHGDTTTSMAAALSAFYNKIKVVHIEAGLRTNNKYDPWPEELNRQITGRISELHFAPSEVSKKNLLKENVDPKKVIVSGNTVIDAIQFISDKIENNLNIKARINQNLKQVGFSSEFERKFILITAHRRENFGVGFKNICDSIIDLTTKYKKFDFVFPLHPNPNLRKVIKDSFKNIPNNLYLIEPLGYPEFVYLMTKSFLILTDSGGIQEEAPGLGKPVLVMRETSERPEAISAGTAKLVGANKENIVRETSRLIEDEQEYLKMTSSKNPYGKGDSSEIIINTLSTS